MQSVGVLALQGSFSEHLTKLAQLTEVLPVAVKTAADLEQVDLCGADSAGKKYCR